VGKRIVAAHAAKLPGVSLTVKLKKNIAKPKKAENNTAWPSENVDQGKP